MDLIRSTLSKTATELVNKRAEIVNLKSGRQEKQKRLEREKANRLEVKSQLAKVTDATISMEAKAQAVSIRLHYALISVASKHASNGGSQEQRVGSRLEATERRTYASKPNNIVL